MYIFTVLFYAITIYAFTIPILKLCNSEETDTNNFLIKTNARVAARMSKYKNLLFNYATNINQKNLNGLIAFVKEEKPNIKNDVKTILLYKMPKGLDEGLKKQFKLLSIVGELALFDNYSAYINSIYQMETIYLNTSLHGFDDKMQKLDTKKLLNVLVTSNKSAELMYIWENWRNTIGQPVKPIFKEYVLQIKKIANANKIRDGYTMWAEDYKPIKLNELAESIYEKVKPLYLQLHGYIRALLKKRFSKIVNVTGPIPGHLISQSGWSKMYLSTLPYPERKQACDWDTKLMKLFDASKMFLSADNFFTSIGFDPLPKSVWEKSKISVQQPSMCHTLTWDFFDGEDFRISSCTNVDLYNYIEAYKCVGSLHYYRQYKIQPYIFRKPACPALLPAIGGAISLSAVTAKHLEFLGFPDLDASPPAFINMMYINALSGMLGLPLLYTLDLWRWHIFTEKILPEKYNAQYWKLINQYVGVSPPIKRTEDVLDAAINPAVLSNIPLMNSYLGYILQFQIFKSLCSDAQLYSKSKPLHKCYLYGQKKVGEKLKKFMELGRSRDWLQALKEYFNISSIDVGPMLEFYLPLMDWLKDKNQADKAPIGW